MTNDQQEETQDAQPPSSQPPLFGAINSSSPQSLPLGPRSRCQCLPSQKPSLATSISSLPLEQRTPAARLSFCYCTVPCLHGRVTVASPAPRPTALISRPPTLLLCLPGAADPPPSLTPPTPACPHSIPWVWQKILKFEVPYIVAVVLLRASK